jgi:hypothetical protein
MRTRVSASSAERFIRQQQLRFPHQRARKSDALLLATG